MFSAPASLYHAFAERGEEPEEGDPGEWHQIEGDELEVVDIGARVVGEDLVVGPRRLWQTRTAT